MSDDFSGRSAPRRPTSSWTPSRADLEVLGMLADGLTIETVARRTKVSERTVRRRLRAIVDEIGVDSTIEAVVHSVRRGLI